LELESLDGEANLPSVGLKPILPTVACPQVLLVQMKVPLWNTDDLKPKKSRRGFGSTLWIGIEPGPDRRFFHIQ